ncbi:MAG: helix-turn-helix transcriptional regulator [Desulfobulbus sp.]|nr:helix-turn-helix transcriptional regulator [Desulfobulbus sp.]
MKVEGIGDRISKIRGRMSIPKFAEMNDVHKSTVIRYEKEETYPDAKFIVDFCNRFFLNPNWLLTGEGPRRVLPAAIELSPEMNELRQNIRSARSAHSTAYFAYLGGDTREPYAFKTTIGFDLLEEFIDKGTYLPTNKELEDLCKLGCYDFNLVKHDCDLDEQDENGPVRAKNKYGVLDVSILKEIFETIDMASKNYGKELPADKKAVLVAMIYEEVIKDEKHLVDIPGRAAKLFQLAV